MPKPRMADVFCAELRRICPNERVPDCPEKDLLLQVLRQAFSDTLLPAGMRDSFKDNDRRPAKWDIKIRDVRQEAESFFDSHRLRPFAKALELDPQEIRAARTKTLMAYANA